MSSLKDLAKKQELIELKVQEQEKTFERIIMNMESGPYLCAFAKNDWTHFGCKSASWPQLFSDFVYDG